MSALLSRPVPTIAGVASSLPNASTGLGEAAAGVIAAAGEAVVEPAEDSDPATTVGLEEAVCMGDGVKEKDDVDERVLESEPDALASDERVTSGVAVNASVPVAVGEWDLATELEAVVAGDGVSVRLLVDEKEAELVKNLDALAVAAAETVACSVADAELVASLDALAVAAAETVACCVADAEAELVAFLDALTVATADTVTC